MTVHEELLRSTATDREYLLCAPAIQRALNGTLTRDTYLAFLEQAYHHVHHTVPLMMAMGARLPEHLPWLREQIVHYIEEENGHDVWILNDIAAAGGDRAQAAASVPSVATEAMVAYAYDTVMRRNPVGFFGMVHVLEGTSAALALQCADRIEAAIGLPKNAFTYLRSHGQLDQEHILHLADIVNRFDRSEDQSAVLQCARGIYWLYGQMFRNLDAATSNPKLMRRSA